MQELEKENLKMLELKLKLVRIGYLEKVSVIANKLAKTTDCKAVLGLTNKLSELNIILEAETKAFEEAKDQYKKDYGEDYDCDNN